MDAAAQHSSSSPFGRAAAVLALIAGAWLLGGCSTASAGREAYFHSRTNMVMFGPGSGETRVSVGPETPFGNDLALADASDDAPRALGGSR